MPLPSLLRITPEVMGDEPFLCGMCGGPADYAIVGQLAEDVPGPHLIHDTRWYFAPVCAVDAAGFRMAIEAAQAQHWRPVVQ